MNQDRLLDLFLELCGLKWTSRAGWAMRGVPAPESVADHSFGVALMTLTLATAMRDREGQDAFDVEKAVSIALLHDLAEVRLGDLPAMGAHLLGEDGKRQAEALALRELLRNLPSGERLVGLWLEFEDAASPEGRLVRDVDKLEMMVQCLRYELAGSRGLEEFWATMDQHVWHYRDCGHLYRLLRSRRVNDGIGNTGGREDERQQTK